MPTFHRSTLGQLWTELREQAPLIPTCTKTCTRHLKRGEMIEPPKETVRLTY